MVRSFQTNLSEMNACNIVESIILFELLQFNFHKSARKIEVIPPFS